MARRSKMKRKSSRKNFSKGNGVHPKNIRGNPMRGGIRL